MWGRVYSISLRAMESVPIRGGKVRAEEEEGVGKDWIVGEAEVGRGRRVRDRWRSRGG